MSHMWSEVDRNVVLRHIPVFAKIFVFCFLLKINVHHAFLVLQGYCKLYYAYFIRLCNKISVGIKNTFHCL